MTTTVVQQRPHKETSLQVDKHQILQSVLFVTHQKVLEAVIDFD